MSASDPRGPEEMIFAALGAVLNGATALFRALDRFPVAAYSTDTNGVLTHFNSECIDFAGREPTIGTDKWCVTWKLYSDTGEFLPHDCCPMARAIREQRILRGCWAVAERPDTSRVSFVPYPTPLWDNGGRFTGALNLLMDLSEPAYRRHLAAQAERCGRLAGRVNDEQAINALSAMAAECSGQLQAPLWT